jgi:hypothetical protein
LTLVLPIDQAKAVAANIRKPLEFANLNQTPLRRNQAVVLKRLKTFSNTCTPDSEQLRQYSVSQRNLIFTQFGSGEQKPSREPMLKTVDRIARARLRGLDQNHTEICMHDCAERWQFLQSFTEFTGSNPQRLTRDLHRSAV